MPAKNEQKKWTAAQIEEQIQRIQKVIEQQKRLVKKGENFIAVTPEDIKRKLKRVASPFILSEGWTGLTAPGGTIQYRVVIYNPDQTLASPLFAHVWVGSGNVDPVVGTFLLNVDTRFPRLTQPTSFGLMLDAYASMELRFDLKVPPTVEKTTYFGNCCLMQLNWLDVGQYLDRGVIAFTVA